MVRSSVEKWSDRDSGNCCRTAAQRQEKLNSLSPLFVGRGFNLLERAEIAYRAASMALDPDISPDTVLALAGFVTHHQKTVLVNYELPVSAIGFVMGHNMLDDEYWYTDSHSSMFRPGNRDGSTVRVQMATTAEGYFLPGNRPILSICTIILP